MTEIEEFALQRKTLNIVLHTDVMYTAADGEAETAPMNIKGPDQVLADFKAYNAYVESCKQTVKNQNK